MIASAPFVAVRNCSSKPVRIAWLDWASRSASAAIRNGTCRSRNTFVLNSRFELVGYTIGNDMSSRDIEGANPLYLPQAKIYDACCGLGPWITLADAIRRRRPKLASGWPSERGGGKVFSGETSVAQMARSPLLN